MLYFHQDIESLQREIEDLIKAALHHVLLQHIQANIVSHFAQLSACVKKAFNYQEIEILSRGNRQSRWFTRHLLYKLIKYTSSVGKPTEGWNNPPASTSVTCADDVVRLYQQPLITEMTFTSYETICTSIFPVVERLTCGDMINDIGTLSTKLLYYLLTECMNGEVQALLVCLLLAKDGFISNENMESLIVLLNDIRLSLSLNVINPEDVHIKHFSNETTKHFVSYLDGKISFASQNAMDSVFLVFLELFENEDFPLDLLSVNDEFLRKYCRTAGYRKKPGELCFSLSSRQTKLFVKQLNFRIIDHPTIEDEDTHEIVCEKYNIPPEVSRKGHEEIVTFLKHLQNGKQPFFHARGMVVGCAGTGKTSLIKRIQKQLNPANPKETRAVEVYEHMFAIDNGKLSVQQKRESIFDLGLEGDSTRRSSEQTISMLDFAGHCGYYACHQIYFNHRSFFILVMDLTKPLDIVVEESGNKGTIFERWTYKEFFLFWMKSIHTYSNENAPVILVWTHADKLKSGVKEKKEKMFKTFERIAEILKEENPALLQHIDKTKCFLIGFPKKRLFFKGVDPYSENVEEIKKCIMETSMELEHWGMEIPTLWAIVERNIQKAKSSQKVLFVQELWIQNDDMEKAVRMKDKSELIKILTFYHEVGEILYFPETGLKDYAILDIQWFVDAFKYVISDLKHADLDLENEIKRDKDYKTFVESGELSHHLLQKMWESCKDKCFLRFRTELVTYMERLGLLTSMRVFLKENRASYRVRLKWYVPCMNRKTFNLEDFGTYGAISSILCFEFTFLPNILFYKLIASCMESGWRTLQDRSVKCLYQRVAVFYRFDCFIFLGICRNCIEVQIRNDDQHASGEQRSDIRIELEKNLRRLTELFHKSLCFRIGYKCSRTNFCDASISEVIYEERKRQHILCNLCPVSRKHRINHDDLTWKLKNEIHRKHPSTDPRDFEILLDMVASKVSREIHMIATSLHLDQDEVDQIMRDNRHSMQEKNFLILYHWRNKKRGNKTMLLRALSDVDRQDVVEAIENFNRHHYKCPGVIEPDQQISMFDIRLVSREIAHEYLRLARFLRLPQKKIERVKMDHWSNINECILRTLEQLRNVTRQDLCDSLVYTSRMDITEKLIDTWL